MIVVQARDIFSATAIDGFDRLMLVVAVLIAAAAWRPEVVAYTRANSKANADRLRVRPLGWRTLLVSMSGASVAAGTLTAIAPRRAVFALVIVACFAGAAVTASVWTAIVLVPLAHVLPEGKLPGAAGTMLHRMGRNPWYRIPKVLAWSTAVGASIGGAFVLYRTLRIGDSAHALAMVGLFAIGAMATGHVLWLALWGKYVGEYAKTGVVERD